MPMREINESVMNRGPRHAVLYARVSSKEQEQGYSILAQQALLRPYALEHDLIVDEEFVDVATAKKAGRPGFNAMLHYLQKNPGCRLIVVEKTDRLYRNITDAAKVEELGVELHLVKENQVLSKASRAADKHRHGINVLDARRYVDNLSEEVQKGMRTKAAQGIWPSYAPLGYRNTERADGKRIIVPDAILGPMVTSLFEWFAGGEYSLKLLAQRAYEEGFRFRKSSGKIPVTTLQKMLRKRLYMGEFEYGGVRYQGIHEPLVSRAVWDRVQEILDGRHRKKHRKVTHEFRFSGMVSCRHCGCSLVAELKKGRYVYYHCTGYRGKCGEPYMREETLEKEFANALQELILPPAILRWLQAEAVESEKVAQAAHAQAEQRHREDLERLQRRQEIMYEDRLDGRIDAAAYDHKVGQLHLQQEQIRRRIQDAEAAMTRPTSESSDLMMWTRRLGEEFLKQPASEQRKLLHLLVQRASWKCGELRISWREPFEALANREPSSQDGGRIEQDLPSYSGE